MMDGFTGYYDDENGNTIPLGILGHGMVLLERFVHDMDDVLEDPEIDGLTRSTCDSMREQAKYMMITIVALAGREIEEEEFIAQVKMMDDMVAE